jgi:hypothetical protein
MRTAGLIEIGLGKTRIIGGSGKLIDAREKLKKMNNARIAIVANYSGECAACVGQLAVNTKCKPQHWCGV